MTRGEAIAFTKHLYRLQRLGVGRDSPELGESLGFLYHRNNE